MLRYVIYKTNDDFHYLYDLGTGQILGIDKAIYDVIDDCFDMPQSLLEKKVYRKIQE